MLTLPQDSIDTHKLKILENTVPSHLYSYRSGAIVDQ